MKHWFTGFMMSWGMFLAIPCPCRIWDEKARPHMVACLPLTGGVVGLVWAAMAWLLQRLGCAAPLRAVLLAAAPWLVTGFLHLDGYMDVCDALHPMGTSQYAAMQRGTGLQLVFPLVCLLAACVVPPVLCGAAGLAPLAAAAGYCLAVWRGFRQLDGMSGDISGFGLTLGELAGAAVLCLVR